jgi:serine/threonine protein kinase
MLELSSLPFSDISPSNIVVFKGRGVLVDFHAAKLIKPTDGSCSPCRSVTGKVLYMARSLHFSGERQSSATDMESLFYSLLAVASDGRALPWRHLCDPKLIGAYKTAILADDKHWAESCKHCRGTPLVSLLERVREVVQQPSPTLEGYINAFGVKTEP